MMALWWIGDIVLLVVVLPGVFDQIPRELDAALRRLVPPQ